MKILIDRGHSYSAPGAVGYVKEVELTHKWGEAIYNRIKSLGGDVVLLQDGATVSTDLSVPVKQANAFGKDCVFLSVHANSAADPSANGSEIFCYKGAYKGKTKELTDAVYNAYRSVVPDLRNRGVKQADYYVLRETVMPATLLELGFVGNNKDAVIISDPGVIARGADAMARALMKVAGQPIGREHENTIAEGFYIITSRASGKALDLNKTNGRVAVYDKHGGNNQQWVYVNGFFKSVENGLVLDVERGSKDAGARIVGYQALGGANQKFVVDSAGHIITHNGMCLDVSGGSTDSGTPVIQYPITGGMNQLWDFHKLPR